MAKIRGVKFRPRKNNQTRIKQIRALVTVSGQTGRGPRAFYACATLGTGRGRSWNAKKNTPCAYGKNPRVAVSKVLRKVAGVVGKRSGAFAGLKKGKK